MSKKECFIKLVEKLMEDAGYNEMTDEAKAEWADALDFWNGLQVGGGTGKPKFTDNGKLVLTFMKENKDTYKNLFKAKDVGEGLGIASRTASGAMRKLVTDGYIEKVGADPVVYAITQSGIDVDVDAE